MPVFRYLLQAKNNYALVLKDIGAVIGSVGLNEDADGNEDARNVGFFLDEAYWNQGLMTEGLRAIISNAIQLTPMLSLGHAKGNTRSEHIAKKLGFTHMKTFTNIKRECDEFPHDNLY